MSYKATAPAAQGCPPASDIEQTVNSLPSSRLLEQNKNKTGTDRERAPYHSTDLPAVRAGALSYPGEVIDIVRYTGGNSHNGDYGKFPVIGACGEQTTNWLAVHFGHTHKRPTVYSNPDSPTPSQSRQP